MSVYDALFDTDIRVIHTRHESAAVFMAESYSQVSGKIGVALVTAAPGFANALGALYSAAMSNTALLLLSGDSPVAKDGLGAFQELDQATAAAPFVKASYRLTASDDPATLLFDAYAESVSGVPGPVHVALPADVLEEVTRFNADLFVEFQTRSDHDVYPSGPSLECVNVIETLFEQYDQPLIIVGAYLFRGDRKPTRQLLTQKLGAPVMILDSPRGLRDPAQPGLQQLLDTANCILYIGKPVDFTTNFGADFASSEKHIVFVSADGEETNRVSQQFENQTIDVFWTDPELVIDALIDERNTITREGSSPDWVHYANGLLSSRALAHTDDNSLASKAVVETVGKYINQVDDAILICDGGEFGQWSQAFANAPTRVINGPGGAIGAGLPYAIGAKVANPDAQVFVFMGDGTVGFHLAEFETAVRESLPFIVIIGNDSKWHAEYHIQGRDYGKERTFGCELSQGVRYDQAAIGLGANGALVDSIEDLDSVLGSIEESSSVPTCLNVIIPGAPAPVFSK